MKVQVLLGFSEEGISVKKVETLLELSSGVGIDILFAKFCFIQVLHRVHPQKVICILLHQRYVYPQYQMLNATLKSCILNQMFTQCETEEQAEGLALSLDGMMCHRIDSSMDGVLSCLRYVLILILFNIWSNSAH